MKKKGKALECQTKLNMLQLPHKNDLNIKPKTKLQLQLYALFKIIIIFIYQEHL